MDSDKDSDDKQLLGNDALNLDDNGFNENESEEADPDEDDDSQKVKASAQKGAIPHKEVKGEKLDN
jgi:hypothetical protein